MSTHAPVTNYNGIFCCSGQENMEELLSTLGVGWMKRKAASAMGYGVGKLVQTLEQDGNNMSISNKGGQKNFVNNVVVGTEQQLDSDDGIVPVTTHWDSEGNLVMNTLLMGKEVTIVRKMIGDNEMKMVISFHEVSAIRKFTRK